MNVSYFNVSIVNKTKVEFKVIIPCFLIHNFDWNRQFINRLQISKGGIDYRIKIGHLWLPLPQMNNVTSERVCVHRNMQVYILPERWYAYTSKYQYIFPFFTWVLTHMKHCPTTCFTVLEIMVIIPHQSRKLSSLLLLHDVP